MILDGHIHLQPGEVNREDFLRRLNAAGISGGTVISISPNYHRHNVEILSTEERLDNLFSWTGEDLNLFPFFWIDPIEESALDQIEIAVSRGVKGFKVICNHFYPGDTKAMDIYAAIAKNGKPILFHSGILWDGHASSKYNKPSEFEALLDVDGLKFALAHVSWPWYDENLAVYGKFLNAYGKRPKLSVEMFIDVTPGTPPIYREEVLTKMFTIGYKIKDNVIFGVDCNANSYGDAFARQWIARDKAIYEKLGLETETVDKVFANNLKRFIGINP